MRRQQREQATHNGPHFLNIWHEPLRSVSCLEKTVTIYVGLNILVVKNSMRYCSSRSVQELEYRQ